MKMDMLAILLEPKNVRSFTATIAFIKPNLILTKLMKCYNQFNHPDDYVCINSNNQGTNLHDPVIEVV